MPVPPPSTDPAGFAPPPPEPAGVVGGAREMLRAVLHHAHLRWALFGLEAVQAGGHLGRVALAVAVLALSGGLGYLTAWAVVILWAARRWAGGDLLPPLAVMAGFHLLLALGAGWWLAVHGRRRELFAATRAEFAEDQQWLQHPNQ
jgi:uncharacterized membrane protein YqjE